MKIAIIGAGPAGCTLGRLLYLAKVDFVIFERETSPAMRGQGGTLDLRTKGGLAAVKKADLFEEFLKFARYDGEALCVTDKNYVKYINFGAKGASASNSIGRPEIDRVKLRQILLDSVPKDSIRWGSKLLRVDEDHNLHFEHGIESGFSLIVGAEGAWSRVRLLLSDQKPFYTGVSGAEFSIADVEARNPDAYKMVNRGSLFAYDKGHGLTAQQIGDGHLKVGTWMVVDEDWVKQQDTENTSALKAKVLEQFSDWHPKLLSILEAADENGAVVRAIYMLPVGFRWKNVPGVTLIGDAAHLMCPFAGEGVNLSMEDSMYLADAIIKSSSTSDLEANVASFEEKMFKRAALSAGRSNSSLEDYFMSEGSIRANVEGFILRGMASEMNWVTVRFASIFVYIWFFFFRIFY